MKSGKVRGALLSTAARLTLQDNMPPRVQRRVTIMREDPALRELPKATTSGKERRAEATETGAAKRGAANIVPVQERGALAPQAELRLEDILGEPAVHAAVMCQELSARFADAAVPWTGDNQA